MAKVFGIHAVELRPGVKEEEFEQFVLEKVMSVPLFAGWKARLLKADRGERTGKYAILIEIDSVEARDRFSPAPNQLSEEARAFDEQRAESVQPVWDKWGTYATTMLGVDTVFTDYVEVSKG